MSRAKPRAALVKPTRNLAFLLLLICFALLILFFTSTTANAQPGYQEYYVLGYEEHAWQAFNEIIDGAPVAGSICSIVSLVATADHQIAYYDHWEDGYEADLLHPIQNSTEVYTLTVGASLSLSSTQASAPDTKNQYVRVDLGRDSSEIRYDGGDRIVTSGGPVALTHMVWPLNNSWVGGAWEILSQEAYADTYSYHLPIGEDLYTFGGGDAGTYGDFRNVYLELVAFEDNTNVSVDNHADTVNLILDRGQSYSSLGYVSSSPALSITINAGTSVRSNKPVQVGLITGADGEFQGRFLLLLPDEHLGADYVVPVPSGNPGHEAEVYLSNPNDFPITVHAYDAVVQPSFVISPTGYISATVPYSEKRGGSYVPAGSAARFTSSDGLFGIAVCADTSSATYDWGFAGIPAKYLTRDYYVSWAPGDSNAPSQNNGSPVWVTPLGDSTTFYVDYSPLNGIVDQTFTLDTLQQRRIFDPDNDNTGMHIWATGEFAVVWGEDPLVADSGTPYLDLGVSVLPSFQQWLQPVLTLDKTAEPAVLPPEGGTVTFTLIARAHSGPLVNIDITDTLPISWIYVPGQTTVRYPDGSTATPEPMISDQTLFWDLSAALDVNQSLALSFQAHITTAGGVGAAAYEGFESRTYSEGENWSGSSWQEVNEGDGPTAGGITITDTAPFLGAYHLSIVSSTRSLSRTVDLSGFTSPVLRFARRISTAASSEYFLDIQTEAGWATVLTWTNSNLQGAYIQETADLARTDTAIRFRSGDSIAPGNHLYVDEIEIYDAIAINTNRGKVIGELQYTGTSFNSTAEADVVISPLKIVKSVSSTDARIKDTLVYTLSYVNLSDSVTISDVVLYDAVPIQYVTFKSASDGGTYSGASGTITWTLGAVEPGNSGAVTFTVTVNDFVEDGTVIENRAYIASTQTARAGSNTVRTNVQAPDIAFTKSGPAAAERGQVITYTLSYENIGGAQATGVVIRDVIPVSTTYVAGSMAIMSSGGWIALSDAAGDDLGTYIPVSPTLIITPGNVAAGDTGMIRFNVRIDADLSPGSLIHNWATLDRDMDIPRESNLATTRISELLIDKTVETAVSPIGLQATVAPGGLITYCLSYENVSTTTLQTDVYVREPIPDYTRFVTASGAISYSWNQGTTWSATQPITPVTHIRWYESTLPTSTRRAVSLTVRVSNTLPTSTDIENIAYISSTQTATYPNGWIPSNQIEVQTVDLWMRKRANPSAVGAGGLVSYTISYGNRGSADAFDVQILDIVPTNTEYVTGSIQGTGKDDREDPLLTWDVMTVTAGESTPTVGYAVTVDSDVLPGSTITNTAVLSSAYGFEVSEPALVTVLSSADLAVRKLVERNTVAAGEKLTYTIVISNDGSGHAFGAVVSDTFSTEVQLVPNSISLDPPGAGTIGTDLPILAEHITITGGQRVTVTFAITIVPPVPDGTVITNTVSITSTYTPTPRTALVTATVHSPVFTLTKHASPGNWSRRMKLTFTNMEQAENLMGFPVLVVLDSSRIDYNRTQDAGQDIRFVDPDSTELLAHEIEEWNESGTSYVWVKVPQIDGSSDTDYIWMYYGNPNASDVQDPTNVWDSSYKGVWHLQETARTGGGYNDHLDSTSNDNDGEADADLFMDRTGQIDGADEFNNNAEVYVADDDSLDLTTDWTIEAWMSGDTLNTGYEPIMSKYSDGNRGASLYMDDTNVEVWYTAGDGTSARLTSNSTLLTDIWYYLAATFDNGDLELYIDGSSDTSVSGQPTPYTYDTDLCIGKRSVDGGNHFDGLLDELRISDVARSADWIAAQHKSMTDSFIVYGSEEVAPPIVGAPFTYTITITNTGSVTATNVIVTDTLPDEANYISGGVFFDSSNTVSWTIPSIGDDDSERVAAVVSTCQVSLVNTLYKVVTSTQRVDSPAGPALLTLLATPALNAQFSYDPLSITIGDTVTFTDTSTTTGGPLVSWGWDFGDGDTARGPIVTHIYSNPGTYTVTLTVTDTCGFTDTVTAALSVYAPVLTVAKRAARSVVRAGETLQYNIIISNTGQMPVTGVLVSDTLPAHTSFVDAIPAAIGPLNGVITWSLGTLDVGATQPITVIVQVDSATVSGTRIANTIAVTSAQGIGGTDAVTVSVETAANLAVSKSSDPGLFIPGETLTYTLTYINYGPSDAQEVTITDTLPVSVTYGGVVSSPLPDPTEDGQSLTWYTPTLSAGESGAIVFTVTVGADTFPAITNTVTITSVTTDPNLSNNTFERMTRQLPVVNFAGSNFSAGESAGSTIITAILNYPFTSAITATYQTTTGGTATPGADYISTTGTFVFPAWTTSQTSTVSILPDLLDEENETVVLTLTGTSTGTVGTTYNPAILTIVDDDPWPYLSIDDVTVPEGDSGTVDAVFTLSLDAASGRTVRVDYTTADNTATAPADYSAIGITTLLFAPGETTKQITVTVQGDSLVEGDETYYVNLTYVDYATVTDTQAIGTITDNDTARVSIATQNNAAEPNTDGQFVLSLSRLVATDLTVDYTVDGTASNGADYAFLPGSVVIPANSLGIPITVTVIDDIVYEGDEIVQLTLIATDNPQVSVGTPDSAILTITDDDQPTVDFASDAYIVSEDAGSAEITVTLSGQTLLTTTVNYATSDNTATAPDDYAATSGTLTFVPGMAQRTFLISIVDDGLYEGTETLHLELSSPVNATLGTINNPATLVIQDNISNVAIIQGTVFEDVNGNGLQDGGETGLSDVLVTLDGTITTTTNATGDYFFSTSTTGAHTVVETDPRVFATTEIEQAPASATDQPDYISTTPNEVNVNVTLGNIYQVNFGDAMTDLGFGIIYGIAFEDADGDGVQDATEIGISNVSIALDQTATVATDLNGSYTLSTTVPTVHTVAATQPGGYFATTPPQAQIDVVLGNGYQIDFGNAPASAGFAVIYGTVFGDDNANGVYGPNETGIYGVSVALDGNLAVTTDRYGGYSFVSTTPGTHVVLETDPNSYSSTTPNMATVNVALGSGYQVDFGDMEITTCDPDLYEHDEIAENARLVVLGTNQVRQFCDDAIDWAWFAADAGEVYTITATSWGQRADTILTLFDTEAQTLLAQNDDYLVEANDGSSRITWQAPVEGSYYLRVTNKRDLTGKRTDYDLRVQSEGTPLPIYLPVVMRNIQ